jgi:hypothetical protein
MFDKYKARIKRIEETNDAVHSTAQHVREHQLVYVAGATGVSCLLIGAIGSAMMGKVDTKQVVDSFKLLHIQYKSPNVNIALVKKACPAPIPVLHKPSGEAFCSIRRAAQALDLDQRKIAMDMHGAQELFERLPESVFA